MKSDDVDSLVGAHRIRASDAVMHDRQWKKTKSMAMHCGNERTIVCKASGMAPNLEGAVLNRFSCQHNTTEGTLRVFTYRAS